MSLDHVEMGLPPSSASTAALDDRVLARLIDLFYALPVLSLVFTPLALWTGDVEVALGDTLFLAPLVLAAWDAAEIHSFGATPGKRRLGLVVLDANGATPSSWRAFVRPMVVAFAFMVWWPFAFIVVAWGAIDPHRRGLHDLAAGTWVHKVVDAAPAPELRGGRAR